MKRFNRTSYPFSVLYPSRLKHFKSVGDGTFTYPFAAGSEQGDIINLTYHKHNVSNPNMLSDALDAVERGEPPPQVWIPASGGLEPTFTIFEEPIVLLSGQKCFHVALQHLTGGVPVLESLVARVRHGNSILVVDFCYMSHVETRLIEWEGILRSIQIRDKWQGG